MGYMIQLDSSPISHLFICKAGPILIFSSYSCELRILSKFFIYLLFCSSLIYIIANNIVEIFTVIWLSICIHSNAFVFKFISKSILGYRNAESHYTIISQQKPCKHYFNMSSAISVSNSLESTYNNMYYVMAFMFFV
jgi:hypothetical protein